MYARPGDAEGVITMKIKTGNRGTNCKREKEVGGLLPDEYDFHAEDGYLFVRTADKRVDSSWK